MKDFYPEILIQEGPCMMEQKAVSESFSGKFPDFSVPVKVMYRASFLSIFGIKGTSADSSSSRI